MLKQKKLGEIYDPIIYLKTEQVNIFQQYICRSNALQSHHPNPTMGIHQSEVDLICFYVYVYSHYYYNLLRNEYNIPFINIYDFNQINDFINPAVIHDAKLVCKFIKEAMFLREHPSVDQN